MNLTPEMKAQLKEQKKQCVHCKLISGEMEGAKTIFKDKKTVAMLDIYPLVKAHTSFMTIEHYPMPAYIPGDEFTHMFSLIPDLAKALQSATVSRGFNVFIAVGGPAGQMSPHFLVHLMPRDPDDEKFQFMFKTKDSMEEGTIKMLSQNLPIMMTNHFKRNPNEWHKGKGNVPSYLSDIYETNNVVYEDEQVLCIAPKKTYGKAHLVIYSKIQEKEVKKLNQEQSAHLFFTASFASTALFEGLKCHATNIILKSGQAPDNPSERLAVHVFGRWDKDGLEAINWEPKQTQKDLTPLQKKLKDKTMLVKFRGEKKKEKKPLPITKAPDVVKITSKNNKPNHPKSPLSESISSVHDEILRAIKRVRK